MIKLSRPLEVLAKSDVNLLLVGTLPGDIGERKLLVCSIGDRHHHLAVDRGFLDFLYRPGKVSEGGLPFTEMITLSQVGSTRLAHRNGDLYEIHREAKTMPPGYCEFSVSDYHTKIRELRGE